MEWKTYDELYEVSECGDVANLITGRVLKPRVTPEGYVYFAFHGKKKKVHLVVAKLFIENPNNYRYINHKDGIKANNHYTNLEWCTQGHNLKHAWDNGLNSGPSKKVFAYRNDEFVGEYKSQYECARQLDLGLSSVCGSLQSGLSCFGYTFKRA